MSRTGRTQEADSEDGAPAAPSGGGGAPGRRTRVEAAMARMGGAPAQAQGDAAHGDTAQEGDHDARPSGRTAQQQLDREAGLISRGNFQGAGAIQAFPAPDGSTPQQRHDAAVARLEMIDHGVHDEDITATDDPTRRTGQTKDDSVANRHRVRAQLDATGTQQRATDARGPSATAATANQPEPVAAFERAVRAYQDAYLRTYLVSTDGAVDPTQAWTSNEWREKLSNRTAAITKLRGWAGQSSIPYIKFVVPASHPNEVYVGVNHDHGQIAQDNVLTAGILHVRDVGGQLRVSELGNSSGGYRPGPLRNAIVLSRLIDAGLVQDTLSGTDVDNRDHGTYDDSPIAHPH